MNCRFHLPKKVRSFLSGVVIGGAAILPGISGASLTVLFSVHEDITSLLADPFRRFKQFMRQYFFLVLGSILGFVGTSGILSGIFLNHTAILLVLFSGFIAGTFPGLYRRAAKNGIHRGEVIAFLGGAALMVALAILNYSTKNMSAGTLHTTNATMGTLNLTTLSPQWVAMGTIIGCGSLLPGISASFFLVYLDWYMPLLSAVISLRILPLAQTAFGFIVTLIALSRVTNLLYRRFNSITSFAVLGCTLGSFALIIPLLPELTIQTGLLFILGFSISFFIDTRNKNHTKN